jgi:methylthioribose-1-phosphate isomerase
MGRTTAPPAAQVYNPAFDVTPANLVTAIITEHGVAVAPYEASLKDMCQRKD